MFVILYRVDNKWQLELAADGTMIHYQTINEALIEVRAYQAGGNEAFLANILSWVN